MAVMVKLPAVLRVVTSPVEFTVASEVELLVHTTKFVMFSVVLPLMSAVAVSWKLVAVGTAVGVMLPGTLMDMVVGAAPV